MSTEIRNQASNELFTLKIYSPKTVYQYGEDIAVEAELIYNGDDDVKINHTPPLLIFRAVDDKGTWREEAHLDMNVDTRVAKGFLLSDKIDLDDAGIRGPLPPAYYTITASVKYQHAQQEYVLETSIPIQVVD